MASRVSICNNALIKLKTDTITALDENSQQARLLNAIFEDSLDLLLQMHPWNFATYRATLAQLATTPDFEFDYEHELPTDPYCLQVQEFYGDYDYKIEERKLLSDQDTVEIKYIGRVEDMNVLSPLFREAFSDFLASKIAYALTGSNGVKDRMEQNFLASFKMARLRDSQEDTPDDISTGSWIEGRG